jgi:hypothetical protein
MTHSTDKIHTRVTLWVKPYKEPINHITYLFSDVIIKDIDEAENYLDYNNPGNFIITNVQYYSTYGVIENWHVIKVEQLSEADLGFEYFIAKCKEETKLKNIKEKRKADKEKKKNFELHIKEIKKGNNGWLDTYGNFYFVYGFANHNEWAYEFLKKNNLEEEKIKEYIYPYEILEDRGWIRILTWSDGNTRFSPENAKPTKLQEETLVYFCKFHNVKYPEFVTI